MISYQTFRNTDPPELVAIWRSRAGQDGLARWVSPDLFEQLVFAKLYFDYEGLMIAREDGRPVGFAHAGFGPNEARDRISTESGTTCMVMVRPDCPQQEVAAGLLERAEQYLRQRGAKVLYGGGMKPLNPFYLGLYGGSELPGVLHTDCLARETFASHGYDEIDRTLILRRDLSGFEAVIDRRQMQIRRRMIVEVTADPPAESWWDASVVGEFDLTRFELVPRETAPALAWATFRSMEPSGTAGVGRAAGLMDLHVDESLRRRGLAVFLLSEAFRQFIRQGIHLVEVQTTQHNAAALGLFRQFGFQETGRGSVFRKR
ncbi:MAG TPA: GNAT family N-acetyltransferase [Thermoguttaceae bacterium]|nr:GNAT family N-acetyltransferase [Thermoguttaceae bacterium]